MTRHRWDMTPKEAVQLQRQLAGSVRVEPLHGPVHTVAGADCAFLGGRRILAAAVLCEARTMKVIATAEAVLPLEFPYIPGLLSFREAPSVIAAVEKLPCRPDLLLCDGQGLAHPRGLGLASHVGLWLDLPTVGVAKSILCGEHRPVGPRRGSRRQLRYKGAAVGAALRTRDHVRELYVSPGHRVTLEDAIRWTLRGACHARLPEPTRHAHQYVTRRKIQLGG
jgi:deoxyribonuclease V